MPYKHEFARYEPLHRLLNNVTLAQRLQQWTTQPSFDALPLPAMVPRAALFSADWQPAAIVAIDGSLAEAPLTTSIPQATVGYISVAATRLDWLRLRELDAQRPIAPSAFRSLSTIQALHTVLPGPLVTVDSAVRPVDALRRYLFATLAENALPYAHETLLETYEALLQSKIPHPPRHQRCPLAQYRCRGPSQLYHHEFKVYMCHCSSQQTLYSTDALRLHERFPLYGSFQTVLVETMRVVEHLWLVHHLRCYEHQQRWQEIQATAFLLDGPLALFGSAGWLSRAIRDELRRITAVARVALDDPSFHLVLFGVEKTGQFVEYFRLLDAHHHLPTETLWLLDDAMIKQTITGSHSERAYGRNTYYGRKLFYKSSRGQHFVLTLLGDEVDPDKTVTPDDYPRLADSVNIIETVSSSRYPDALVPLVHAHMEAALPKHVAAALLRHREGLVE